MLTASVFSHRVGVSISVWLCLVFLLAAPALSVDEESLTPPEQKLSELLELAEAYQVGYLQVVAASCFQLYASTGIIATDFASGHIDTDTAISALDENSLLHSVCISTLTTIENLTPSNDIVARDELQRLHAILAAEQNLLLTLRDVMIVPSEDNAAIVESHRATVEQEISAYLDDGNELVDTVIEDSAAY